MKQLFRWPGLIAFVVITGALAAFWLLLANTLIKMSVESIGSDLVGAEVNLDAADITLDPLQVRLTHLQVTDPEHPMRNMLELDDAIASVEPWKLLMGQLIVNDLTITQLKLNTERSRSGALKEKPEKVSQKKGSTDGAEETSALQEIQTSLPSVSTVLGQEELLVCSRAQTLKSSYAEEQAKLDTLIAKMPDTKTRQQYKERFARATKGETKTLQEFNRRKNELDQLKKELQEVKQTLEQSRHQVVASKTLLQEQLAALKSAPGEDWKRLTEKYSLSTQGGLNLSRILFGDKIGSWAETALRWYRRIEPFLASEEKAEEQTIQRARGRYIHFPSSDPTPDFLLRRAQLQAVLPFGEVDGVLADVTHQPSIIGRPATFKAKASQLNGLERFSLDATFDHVSAQQAKDEVSFSLQALQLEQIQLGSSEEAAITLAQALSDIDGSITLQREEINAEFTGRFRNAQFESPAKEGLAGEIAKSLASIDLFSIEGTQTLPQLRSRQTAQ